MVVLRDIRDAHGSRHLEARLEPNGELVIEGQDLGEGVESVFGAGLREYEWQWRLPAAAVPLLEERLATALDAPVELGVLSLLFLLYEEGRHDRVEDFIGPQEGRIPARFWNRVGD